jgi:hypothetical protein
VAKVIEPPACISEMRHQSFLASRGGMKWEDVQLGMLVQVRRGSREAELRDRIGIVRQRIGKHPYSPFEVQFERFEDKQHELLWANDFEEW